MKNVVCDESHAVEEASTNALQHQKKPDEPDLRNPAALRQQADRISRAKRPACSFRKSNTIRVLTAYLDSCKKKREEKHSTTDVGVLSFEGVLHGRSAHFKIVSTHRKEIIKTSSVEPTWA